VNYRIYKFAVEVTQRAVDNHIAGDIVASNAYGAAIEAIEQHGGIGDLHADSTLRFLHVSPISTDHVAVFDAVVVSQFIAPFSTLPDWYTVILEAVCKRLRGHKLDVAVLVEEVFSKSHAWRSCTISSGEVPSAPL
jgi:hypothetical protein